MKKTKNKEKRERDEKGRRKREALNVRAAKKEQKKNHRGIRQ